MKNTFKKFFLMLLLACKMIKRQLFASEFKILIASLILGVFVTTLINYFATRLYGAMHLRATEFLAADLVLSSTNEINHEKIARAKANNLNIAQTVEFVSMVGGDEAVILAAIKAVSESYPLRGNLETVTDNGIKQDKFTGENIVWVEQELINALNINVGEFIDIGSHSFMVDRIVNAEPDKSINLYSLSPRIFMNIADLPKTEVLGPGSRINYRLLVQGDDDNIENYKNYLQSNLSSGERIRTVHDTNPQLGASLTRAQKYLSLSAIASLVLTCVAVSLAASSFANNNINQVALLKSLGLRKKDVLILLVGQIAIVGLIASVIGALLGLFAQEVLFILLKGLLPKVIPSVTFTPFLISVAVGFIVLIGFALPKILTVLSVSPIRVLREDINPIGISSFISYSITALAVLCLCYFLSAEILISVILLSVILLLCLIIFALFFIFTKVIKKYLSINYKLRLSLGRLVRFPVQSVGQIAGFSIILLLASTMFLIQNELVEDWSDSVPADTPNNFIINILPSKQENFLKVLQDFNVQKPNLYPVASGRLTHINHISTDELRAKNIHESLNRDLQMSWSTEQTNTIVQGKWFNDEIVGVSIEDKLANSLNVSIGDVLNFTIGAQSIVAPITSIRSVDWQSFRPNFYYILHPKIAENIPFSYMSAFNSKNDNNLLAQISKQIQGATVISVDSILVQVASIISQVSQAVQFVMFFILLSGFVVFFAGIETTVKNRRKQNVILKTIGDTKRNILQIQVFEFIALGFFSGLIAQIGTEIVVLILYKFVFNIAWSVHFSLFLLPIIGVLIIGFIGFVSTKKIIESPSIEILREV